MEPHPHRNHYRLLILTLFVGLTLIVMSLVFYYQRLGMLQRPEAADTLTQLSPIPVTQSPLNQNGKTGVSFTLMPDPMQNTYSQGFEIPITLTGDSNKYSVLGYDVIVSRDAAWYDVVGVRSLLPEFTVFKFVKDNKITITGILKPSVTKPIIFTSSPIVELIVRPKKSGILTLTVLTGDHAETTKIISVDAANKPIKYPLDTQSALRLDIQ